MMKKVLTIGVYDLLHLGHIELFRKAKALGDYLIVAVQDADFVTKFKPDTKLVYTTEQRLYMVSSVKFVDEVVEYQSADQIVKTVDFDILAVGPDQTNNAFILAKEWCKLHGKNVITIPRTSGVSSSALRKGVNS
jgi:glycerol-3-phosphate cytidylyltransferase